MSSRVVIWNDPFWRALVFQALALALVGWFGFAVWENAAANLRSQNITSGFGFLDNTSGFAVTQSLVEYSEDSTYARVLLVGFLNTLLVSVCGIILASVVGLVVGIARLSDNWIVSRLAAGYVEVIRNVPLLLQIFILFFGVLRLLPAPRESLVLFGAIFVNNRGMVAPSLVFGSGSEALAVVLALCVVLVVWLRVWARRRQVRTGRAFPVARVSALLVVVLVAVTYLAAGRPVGLDMPVLRGFNFEGGFKVIPSLVALTLALGLYTASFIAEIVRAGIQAVDRGQREAAYALGLRPGATLRLVILPQAVRVIIPPLTSQYLNLTKNSSLAAAIAYPDIVNIFAGTVLNLTGQAVEVLFIAMSIYLFLSIATSLLMNWYNARMALVER